MGRILLTDWEGPIAGALVRALLRDPRYDVRVLAPSAPPDWVAEACEVVRAATASPEHLLGCDALVDLAACRPADREALSAWPLSLAASWQRGAAAAATAACEAHTERLIHIGAPVGTIAGDGPAIAAAKGAAALAAAARAQAGISACVLWPFGPLWPQLDSGMPGSPGILARAVEGAIAGEGVDLPPTPWKGAYTAVEEIAAATVLALESDSCGEIDIAGGWRPDGEQLASIVSELAGRRLKVRRRASGDAHERRPDRAGARRALGFSTAGVPRRSIEAIVASLAGEASAARG